MDLDKIVQIIPAPNDMWAWYKDETTGYIFPNKVVCLALVEDFKRHRSVRPMILGGKDLEALEAADPAFIGFSFLHMEVDYPDD